VTMRKDGDAAEGEVKFLKIEDKIPKDLEATFAANAHVMPRARLGAGTWRFEDEPLARLRDKIAKGKKTLGEVYGAPLRGIGLLKEGGRLGFISSSTFFRTGSGEKLRTFLGDRVAVEAVVDFGDQQIFEDVTTYPAIVTMRKDGDVAEGEVKFLKIEDEIPKDLEAAFTATAHAMPRARLGAGTWRFEDEPLARLRDKIAKGKKTLGEVYGAPLRGIVTGLNEAFVIDSETRAGGA